MAGIKGEEFRRTGNVFVNQFMDKQCQSKPDSFSSMKVKLNRLLHWTSRGAADRREWRGEGKQNNAREMVALVFLVSFLLAAQDHGVCWLNQCQPNKCYE